MYVTQMHESGCEYDAGRGGIVFSFGVTGHKDTDFVAEVHQSAVGSRNRGPGPVIASAVHEIRDGDYDNPITILVPLEEGPYPRILDTGCDYAAVGSVAARRAS